MAQSTSLYATGIGEALWDILPEGKKMGGAPANFAYHISQFGLKSCMASAVGHDNLGIELQEQINSQHLEAVIPAIGYPTGTVNVQLDSLGIPTYDITEHVAWDNIPFSERLEELARNTQAVSFGSLAQRNTVSRNTIYRFLDAMPADGTYKVFDINLRQNFYTKEIIDESIKRCNILKINDDELLVLDSLMNLTGDSFQEKCRSLLGSYGLKILILTCGSRGSYVFTTDMTSFLSTPDVLVADTVGAGDSFTAAFVASILRGKNVAEAHQLAVEVAAYVCSQPGAMPVLPAELTARLR